MEKSSSLLRILCQNKRIWKFGYTSRSFSCIEHQTNILPACAAVCNVNKRFYSSPNVSNLEKIYDAPKARHVFFIKLMALATSSSSLLLEFLLVRNSELSAMQKGVWSMIGCVIIITPFLNHFIFRRYVAQMYYDAKNDSYCAAVYSIFATKKYITFKLDEVQALKVEIFSTVSAKGHPLFFDPKNFTDVFHYKRIMGYDKPIDFGSINADELQKDYEKLKRSKEEATETGKTKGT